MPEGSLPLLSLNHISRVVRDVEASIKFYTEVSIQEHCLNTLLRKPGCCHQAYIVPRALLQVLGFIEIKRPQSFDFEGAWCAHFASNLREVQLPCT